MSNFPASGAPSGAEGKVPGFVDAVQRAKEVKDISLNTLFITHKSLSSVQCLLSSMSI